MEALPANEGCKLRLVPYRFVLSERLRKRDGAVFDVADCDWADQHFKAESRHGVTMALARQLLPAGAADGPWEAYGRDEKLRIRGPSVRRLARLTVKETDAGQFRFARYEEWPERAPGSAPDGGLKADDTRMTVAA